LKVKINKDRIFLPENQFESLQIYSKENFHLEHNISLRENTLIHIYALLDVPLFTGIPSNNNN